MAILSRYPFRVSRVIALPTDFRDGERIAQVAVIDAGRSAARHILGGNGMDMTAKLRSMHEMVPARRLTAPEARHKPRLRPHTVAG